MHLLRFVVLGLLTLAAGCAARVPSFPIPTGVERFSTNEYGAVLDHATGFEWFVGPEEKTFVADAQRFVEDLRIGGHADWRLPTVNEIRSIRDPAAPFNHLPPPFRTQGEMIWTGSHNHLGYVYVRLSNGSRGYDTRGVRKHGFRVFAVRVFRAPPSDD